MSEPQAHLLVVDDDERIRGLLQKFLIRNGFLVSVARDAAQARRLLGGLEFDMIVLDLMMPGEDGIALTRDLRKTMTVPILLLTAKGETANRIEGFEAGADDYLIKPFEPKELLLRINAIPVSYTHLDVYKRQALCRSGFLIAGAGALPRTPEYFCQDEGVEGSVDRAGLGGGLLQGRDLRAGCGARDGGSLAQLSGGGASRANELDGLSLIHI